MQLLHAACSIRHACAMHAMHALYVMHAVWMRCDRLWMMQCRTQRRCWAVVLLLIDVPVGRLTLQQHKVPAVSSAGSVAPAASATSASVASAVVKQPAAASDTRSSDALHWVRSR